MIAKKVRLNTAISEDAYEYLRALAGGERKVGETLSSLIADAQQRSGLTESEIYRQIAELTQRLAELKAQ